MDDKNTRTNAMQDRNPVPGSGSDRKNRRPASVMVAGTLIASLAVGVGVQLLRAQPDSTTKAVPDSRVSTDSELSRPAAKVNGEVITGEQLARECIHQFGGEVLDGLISRKIIQQECAEHGVQVTDAEVHAEVLRLSKHAGLPADQWYKFIESERGLNALQYRRDVVWPLLALKRIAGREVEITREMLKEAYIDNYGPRVIARMIMFDKLRRAQEVVAEIKKHPENFEDFAREHSVEPNSRSLGGKIPPIRMYSGAHEEICRTAFRMKEIGEISGLLQVGRSEYVILQYEGRTEPVEHDRNDVHAILHSELVEREVQTLVAETFDTLRKDAKVFNYLTGATTNPIKQTAAVSSDRVLSAAD